MEDLVDSGAGPMVEETISVSQHKQKRVIKRGGYMKATLLAVKNVISAILTTGARKATKYVQPDFVVKASRALKPDGRAGQFSIVVTVGRPNYEERQFIKKCKKVGEPFPVKKVQLKFYPKKKA